MKFDFLGREHKEDLCRGRVFVLMGATLVLAIVNAVYISAPDIPLR